MKRPQGYYNHEDTSRDSIELMPSESSLAFGYLFLAMCFAQLLAVFALAIDIYNDKGSLADKFVLSLVPIGIACFTRGLFRIARFFLAEVRINEKAICHRTFDNKLTVLLWNEVVSIEFLNTYSARVHCKIMAIDGSKIRFLTDKEKPHLMPSVSAMLFGKPVAPGYEFLIRKKAELFLQSPR